LPPDEPPEAEAEAEEELWVEKYSAEKQRVYFKRDSDAKVQWHRPTGPGVMVRPYAEVKAEKAKSRPGSSGRRL